MPKLEYLIGETGEIVFDIVKLREASGVSIRSSWRRGEIPTSPGLRGHRRGCRKTALPGTSNRLDRLAPTAGSLYFCAFVVDPPGVGELQERSSRVLSPYFCIAVWYDEKVTSQSHCRPPFPACCFGNGATCHCVRFWRYRVSSGNSERGNAASGNPPVRGSGGRV